MWAGLLLLAVPAPEPCEVVCVDIIEINHVADSLDQVILWDFNCFESEYDVVAWRLLTGTWDKEGRWMGTPVCRKSSDGRYEMRWYDTKCKRFFLIRAVSYRHTFTYNDPELDHRKHLAQRFRRKLCKGE